MLIDTSTPVTARILPLIAGTKGPQDVTDRLAPFLKAICDRHAVPTDGLGKGQSSLIWQRQIALAIAARTYGSQGPQVDLLNTMIEAERTVWDDQELDRLADEFMCHAELIADEWRGEAMVLRGEI